MLVQSHLKQVNLVLLVPQLSLILVNVTPLVPNLVFIVRPLFGTN